MITSIRDFNYDDWPFVSAHAKAIPCFDTCGVVCVNATSDKVIGAFIFDHVTKTSARLHLAMTHPIACIRGGLLVAAAKYIFVTHAKKVVIAIMPESRRQANRFGNKNGWRVVARIPDGFGENDAAIVREYRAENCPFIDRGAS